MECLALLQSIPCGNRIALHNFFRTNLPVMYFTFALQNWLQINYVILSAARVILCQSIAHDLVACLKGHATIRL